MNCELKIWIALAGLFIFVSAESAENRKPNVIFILADDLGYGDLGCYGQQRIKTPNLDKLATEGTRFTQAYAGCTVCAPSRCALMTGKHMGHATVRGNSSPEVPLRADEMALAEIFKAAGYKTALIGKWGVGENETTGAANKKGFDFFFGYQTQKAAHDYYPPFIWRNTEKITLPDNADGKQGTYTHDMFLKDALSYIRTQRENPFFLYLPLTIPHANNEGKPHGMQVPELGAYEKEEWPAPEKGFAAMITRMDDGVGKIMALLKELELDEHTLVIFTSDNGPHSEGGHKAAFFNSCGALKGIKRDLYEGGIREPAIIRWPGKFPAGKVSDQIWAFWDVLPTLAELCGKPAPKDLDGISVLPAWLGQKDIEHPPLYWEFHERGFSQAARMGNWKGVRRGADKPLELYDLTTDLSEQHDVAAQHADVVEKLEAFLKGARVDSEKYPVKRTVEK